MGQMAYSGAQILAWFESLSGNDREFRRGVCGIMGALATIAGVPATSGVQSRPAGNSLPADRSTQTRTKPRAKRKTRSGVGAGQ